MTLPTLDRVTLKNGELTVEIASLGAELQRLRDREGREWLWSGDPTWWKGRAPLLFPIVGRAAGDRIRVNGADYPIAQHGLARIARFDAIEAETTRCLMRLQDSESTRAVYPFRFRLDVAYELDGSALRIAATVRNEGDAALPCAFGFHPAFCWPLPGAAPGAPHEILFERPETAPIRRLDDGFLSPVDHATPVKDRALALDPALFDDGVVIFDRLASRSVVFRATGGPELELMFPDIPHLGLWTKPGAPFLCIEPWQGFASPKDYDGELADRPGVVSIAPGAERSFGMDIRLKAE
jgi:galactose mutarotase-like enzyme